MCHSYSESRGEDRENTEWIITENVQICQKLIIHSSKDFNEPQTQENKRKLKQTHHNQISQYKC